MATRHVLGLSGGKDSAALAVFMHQQYPELDIEYFFTDTGKELPEVNSYLAMLEGYLGKPITPLNPRRDFDWWLRQYNHYLPSPKTRWCTRQLKLLPFQNWLKDWLAEGNDVVSYVAIRSDEDYREGYISSQDRLKIAFPFREHGIDKEGVFDILEASGLRLPKYYEWRSRSGCTFCFFQQKIEWVRLKQVHPESFEEAKAYEKSALEHGSPFTWSQGEPLTELERPERMAEIQKDFLKRVEWERSRRRENPLRPKTDALIDVDDLYLEDEGGGACYVCHK
jgi:3'-phosphoadenosine 5'-phosphosulfate sulfotransferase (PAPS reductase)/FAD synthetase